MNTTKKLLQWWIEAPGLVVNGKFKTPPKLIKVYDDETCKFFTSTKPLNYIAEFDILFKEGATGNLVEQRKFYKDLYTAHRSSKKLKTKRVLKK